MSAQRPRKIIIIADTESRGAGGGVVGVSTAYFLTRHRLYKPEIHPITPLEACSIAAGSSGKGGSFIASWAIPSCIAPLSFQLHESLAREHDGEKAWGFRKVYAAEIDLEAHEVAIGQTESTPDNRPGDLDWLSPGSVKTYKEIGTPQDSAQVHLYLLTQTLARLAEGSGAAIVIGSATSINHNDNGTAVVSVTYNSHHGETHTLTATDAVVAASPWTSRLIAQVKLAAPKGHSIVVRPSRDHISPYFLFPRIRASGPILSPDIYPRPRDALNSFDTVYASGPDYYDVPLPELASEVEVEPQKCEDVWTAVISVSREIPEGKIITSQACYKAQIKKHEEHEETGPMVGPLGGVRGLWVATGLDEWGVQNGPGVGQVMSEMILEGEAKSAEVATLDPKHWV